MALDDSPGQVQREQVGHVRAESRLSGERDPREPVNVDVSEQRRLLPCGRGKEIGKGQPECEFVVQGRACLPELFEVNHLEVVTRNHQVVEAEVAVLVRPAQGPEGVQSAGGRVQKRQNLSRDGVAELHGARGGAAQQVAGSDVGGPLGPASHRLLPSRQGDGRLVS